MKLVNKDGTLSAIYFVCMDKNEAYRITATESTYQGSIWDCKDTIKRLSDNKKMTITREKIAKRFINVQT